MEFKYYKKEGDSYALITPFERLKRKSPILVLIFFVAAVSLTYLNSNEVTIKDVAQICGIIFCLLFLMFIIAYKAISGKIYILPKDRLIKVKGIYQEQYSLDHFLNFETINIRWQGALSICKIVVMYFDDNNKNIQISIGMHRSKKSASKLMTETIALLKLSDAKNG